MKRTIEEELKNWKENPDRKPLLIRGARQVGKTYIIERFGKECFDSMVTVNFEEKKSVKNAFNDDLDPKVILRDLSARLNEPIVPGKTLLFLDEIQACPNALLSLRFFKEKMPELHVIAAGSLLEFILGDDQFSFPVGRIESCYLRPLSFYEFLKAKQENEALAWIQEATPSKPIGRATHDKLLETVREYFIIGGMPEAVEYFLKNNQFIQLDSIHHNLMNTYVSDFGKYPKTAQQKFMKLLFEAAPRLVGEHFKYAKIHPHAQSRDYMEAIDVLDRTGILHRIYANPGAGIPLESQLKEKKFKLLFLDIGLLPHPIATILDAQNLVHVDSGKVAEQFVGQELVAYDKPHHRSLLYYWQREKKGAEAEVDYLIEVDSEIIPIEVKAKKGTGLRSLRQFMQEKQSKVGLRICQEPLAMKDQILSVPFYMLHEIPRLVRLFL
ncbi:MAG: ATP-binding protein [Verrucomicrobia bacterium]|nr:ATP-binding protein [Verrucomicrobiota bacterium]